jgi:hypothetical protein
VLGLIRMGVTHNLAQLVAWEFVDHHDGDPDAWVEARDVVAGEIEIREGRQLRPVRFTVVVSGKESAEATLWLDEEDGLPVLREQTVEFDEGSMTVVERFTRFELDAPSPG